jgi:arylsulfatase A-like enzyme
MKCKFIGIGLNIILALALLGCQSEQKQNQPNILIIHADQHRIDCIGAYDNKDIKTPNIDNLAKEGVLYHNSYCTLPV